MVAKGKVKVVYSC